MVILTLLIITSSNINKVMLEQKEECQINLLKKDHIKQKI